MGETVTMESLPQLVALDEIKSPLEKARRTHRLRRYQDRFDIILVDESHNFRNNATKRYRALMEILRGGKPALEEMETAVKELGMKGVHIWTRSDGHHLDDREMWPFYAKVAELNVPVDVHVTLEPSGLDAMHSNYGLYYVLAREFDMAISTLRLCLGGVLEDFPDLVFIMNHLGGGVSSVIDRLDAYMDYLGSGWDSFYLDKSLISRSWKEYWDRLYSNVAGREVGIASMKCALSNIKPEKLVFGTDWPFNYDYRPQAIKSYAEEIRKLDLPAGSAEAILGGTAAKILGLDIVRGLRKCLQCYKIFKISGLNRLFFLGEQYFLDFTTAHLD